MDLTIWTVGHSTHSFMELVAVLARYEIEAVADVRRYPGSRRLPHFGEAELREHLAREGIEYEWLPGLGGRRGRKGVNSDDPTVAGWRHPAFRAYAVHLASEEFRAGLEALIDRAERQRTAIMCSEVLWWRCHRRLIADVLTARGARVVHIFSAEKSQPHALRPPARLVDGRLEYPAESPGISADRDGPASAGPPPPSEG